MIGSNSAPLPPPVATRSTRGFIQQCWADSLIISLQQSELFPSRAMIWAEESSMLFKGSECAFYSLSRIL